MLNTLPAQQNATQLANAEGGTRRGSRNHLAMARLRDKLLSLQLKVFLVLAVGTGTLVAALSLVAVITLRENTERSLQTHLSVARSVASQLDVLLDYSLKHLQAQAQAASIVDGPASQAISSLVQRVRLESPIQPLYVAYVDSTGKVTDASPPLAELLGQDRSWLPEVRRALGEGTASLSGLHSEVGGQNAFYLIAPVYEGTGRAAGVLLMAVAPKLSNLAEFLPRLPLGKTGYLEVVDGEGTILASTRPERVYQPSDHGERLASLIRSKETIVGGCHRCHTPLGEGREQEVLAFVALPRFPWGVAIRQDEAELLAPVRRLERTLGLLGALGLGVAVVAVWVGSHRVIAPLRRLTTASARLANGDLETRVPLMGESEVRQLSEALEWARQGLRQREKQLLELYCRREAEIAALVKASASLVTTLDEAEAIQQVLQTVVDTFPSADSGSLFLYDPAEKALVVKAAVGFDRGPLARVRLSPGEAVAGRIFQEGKPLACSTPEEVLRALEGASPENRELLLAARQGKEPQSMVGVPLWSGEAVLGTLVLVSLRQSAAFPPGEVAVMQAFACHVASVLEKARLLREAGEAHGLREADRLKAEFLSNVSHELRTPLTSMRLCLEALLALERPQKGSPNEKLLYNIARNAQRLERLVSDLLDMARIQSGTVRLEMGAIAPGDIVSESVDVVRPLADRRRQTVEVNFPTGLSPVVGDKGRLVQVMVNLLSNAVEYSPEGTAIRVWVQPEDGAVVLAVSDSGPGIPAQELDRVFERFYRGGKAGRPGGSGAGLGLSIARALVQLHGGRIWVQSQPGRGSTFFLSLPTERTT